MLLTICQAALITKAGDCLTDPACLQLTATKYKERPPRSTAPYHTDELLPNETSPIMEELGATKMSSAS